MGRERGEGAMIVSSEDDPDQSLFRRRFHFFHCWGNVGKGAGGWISWMRGVRGFGD